MQFREQVTCTVNQAIDATGLGRTKINEAIGDHRIKSKKVDGRRLLDVASVLRLVSGDDDKPTGKPTRSRTREPRAAAE
jgi:hypothetical protein